jgi:7,8-dihydro-6-hydroxymethylpterin dimethyltransferase
MTPIEVRASSGKKAFPFAVRVEAKAAVRFEDRLERLAAPLRALDAVAARARFALADSQVLLKTTLSVCSTCTRHVPAAVFVESGRVYMKKQCTEHGDSLALLENDVRYYRLASKDKWGRRYADALSVELPAFEGGCCDPGQSCSSDVSGSGERDFSDQQSNKSCTVLIEVTDACNLACRVCYADSRGDRLLPMEKFRAYLDQLLTIKGSLDSVQLIGGESTIHPQFWDMLAYLHADARVRKVYIATNGIELEKGDQAARLVPFKDKVLVLLQFDGAEATTNRALRLANPFRVRERLLQRLDHYDVPMQMTMTLARGVSEREIAWVVRQGVKHRNVRLVAMLPAFFSGRYQLAHDPLDRITLSDVVKGVAAGHLAQ